MTLQEFINKWDDKYCEVSGSASGSGSENQCVDLANAFIDEVQNQPMIFHANAVTFWDLAGDQYDRVQPTDYPLAGDIIIWNTNVGSAGHIAVATGIRNGNKFQTFSQNWPLKSPCHMQDYDFNNLVGYLRLKGEDMGYSEQNVRLIIESALRNDRLTKLGKVDEKGLQADVEVAMKQTATGNVDGIKKFQDIYFKATDCKWIKKTDIPVCPPCKPQIIEKPVDKIVYKCQYDLTDRGTLFGLFLKTFQKK